MRVVSLIPYLTELAVHFGCAQQLVGVSHDCIVPKDIAALPVVTAPGARSTRPILEESLGPVPVDLAALKAAAPSIVVTCLPFEDSRDRSRLTVAQELSARLGYPIKVYSYTPRTFEGMLTMFEQLAKDLEVKSKGIELAQRIKAQVMDWCDNFYDRMKNKKVTFLSGVEPFTLAGLWIPDLIHLASGHSQHPVAGDDDRRVEWSEIVDFRPDVIVVSPRGFDMQAALATFKRFEKLPHWEEIPAVKRGEVVFTEGRSHFYTPGPRLIESMGILISALAGLDSGYLGARDTFFRLRWLEMQRHRY